MKFPFQKQLVRRTAATLLALAMVLTGPALAAYSPALGEELRGTDTILHQQTQLSENVFWSTYRNDFRTEHFITYTPNGRVRPIVTYGGSMTRTSTVSNAAKELETAGYRVVGGINGDFFNMSNGIPTGLVVAEGQIRSSDAGYYALGFRADGSAVMGQPALQIKADLGYTWYDEEGYGTAVSRPVAAINKLREDGGVYLFTYDLNSTHTTGNSKAGVDVICTITEGQLSIGGTLKARVEEVRQVPGGATPVEPNQIVLSVSNDSDAYWTNGLSRMQPGSTVTITVTARDSMWNDVQYALGSLYYYTYEGRLNGELNPTIYSSILKEATSPRTAVGMRNDGSLVFYTVDGRLKGYSYGATFLQSAERLVELGCHTFIGLDGGGSTTIAVTQPDATSARLLNRPSERTERYVSNQIFLIADSTPTGQLDHFFLRPEDNYVLGGSKVNLTVSGVDTNYIPMKADYQLSASAGTVSGAVFTAPAYGGDVTVTASGGGKTGSTVVHVVETPDSLQILNSEGGAVSALTVAPAGEVQLKASATWNHADLFANPECFTWSVAGDMGTINDQGVFQARKPGSGTITVQAGGRTASIPVTVSRVPLWEAEDFEDWIPGVGTDASLSIAIGGELAKFGRGAGQLDYDLTATGRAQWRAEKPFLTVGIPYEAVTLWVNGDGSGNTLSLLYRNGMGEETSLPICTLHFTGWRQAVIPLGYASFASITGFEVTAPGVQPTQASGDVDPWAPPADTALASLFDAEQAAEAELWTSDDGSGGAEAIDPSAIAAPDEETGATAESAAAAIPAADTKPADNSAALMDAETGTDDGTGTDAETSTEAGTGTDAGTVTDAETGTDMETVTDAGTGMDAGTGTEAGTGTVNGTGTDAGTGTEEQDDTRKGRIWLDQMVATYDDLVDSTPPQVTVTLDEAAWEVHATVRDTMDGILPYKSVSVSYNGRPVTDFAYDLNSGFVCYWLPSLTGDSRQPTRITVTAKDASGNIGRGSVDLEPYNTQHHFTDIEGCWAADYIDFLYDNNIASPLEDGKYLPYEPITRVQFAVMLARSVGLDGRNYADVVLPYADLDQIPENALPALKALWQENIMRGADGEDGQLYLYPNNSLTRAQASAMIGRSQKLGYAQAETLPFPDADTIPNYAVSHIQTMVARGILQGYQDGTFKPGAAISRGQMAKILYFLA